MPLLRNERELGTIPEFEWTTEELKDKMFRCKLVSLKRMEKTKLCDPSNELEKMPQSLA
jgi:hypothetical protein